MPIDAGWTAIAAATAHDASARRPFRLLDGGRLIPVGTVARRHLHTLGRWPGVLAVGEHGVDLVCDAAARTRALADIHATLRAEGMILGWRDEPYALVDETLALHAIIERAAARFWGTLTFGVHANGYVCDAAGRPSHLWIARRSATKATDPGKLDNLVGGGVPHGQPLRQALVREAWEEAGLPPALAARATEGRLIRLDRDIPEGRAFEFLQVYDLELPAGHVPANQDGEVMGFARLSLAEAADAAAGDEMTVDAALVTLDFLLRRGGLDPPLAARLAAAAEPLWQPRPAGGDIRWR